jgi:hypothetical protein
VLPADSASNRERNQLLELFFRAPGFAGMTGFTFTTPLPKLSSCQTGQTPVINALINICRINEFYSSQGQTVPQQGASHEASHGTGIFTIQTKVEMRQPPRSGIAT